MGRSGPPPAHHEKGRGIDASAGNGLGCFWCEGFANSPGKKSSDPVRGRPSGKVPLSIRVSLCVTVANHENCQSFSAPVHTLSLSLFPTAHSLSHPTGLVHRQASASSLPTSHTSFFRFTSTHSLYSVLSSASRFTNLDEYPSICGPSPVEAAEAETRIDSIRDRFGHRLTSLYFPLHTVGSPNPTNGTSLAPSSLHVHAPPLSTRRTLGDRSRDRSRHF